MKWLSALVIILAFWFWFAFSFFASNYRVHASTPVVAYCLEQLEGFPPRYVFSMCSELDRYYDA